MILPACQLVGGDANGAQGEEGEPPVVDPAVTLGSASLTASCDADDQDQVMTLSLAGSYDCHQNFVITIENVATSGIGPLQALLSLEEVASESGGPTVGPTAPGEDVDESAEFGLGSATADGGACEVRNATAVCELDPLSRGKSATITLTIEPPPEVATVTTEVVLAEP